MRFTSKLLAAVPDLPERGNAENLYEAGVSILNSTYRDKEFSVACFVVEVCELDRQLWIAHLTNILKHNNPRTLEQFSTIVQNFFHFVEECEAKSVELFGVGIKL